MATIHHHEVEQFAMMLRNDFLAATTVLNPRPNFCGEHLRAELGCSLLILIENDARELTLWCSNPSLGQDVEKWWHANVRLFRNSPGLGPSSLIQSMRP